VLLLCGGMQGGRDNAFIPVNQGRLRALVGRWGWEQKIRKQSLDPKREGRIDRSAEGNDGDQSSDCTAEWGFRG
jgi:hypothetical protein